MSVDTEVELVGNDVNHAHRVLRLRVNDPVAIADGRGKVRRGLITFSASQTVRVRLFEELMAAESPLQ
ncbi:MAG TPA: RNA methyltransferase PUA domain-containing protein, partial [Candidatus Limnocylindrales bacterium]|nr:RNA methyltransferase PUA domain-containing protein [Candidatus Limnocylindrales bacterium]